MSTRIMSDQILDHPSWIRPPSDSIMDMLQDDQKDSLRDVLGRKLLDIPPGVIPKVRLRGSKEVPSPEDLTLTDVVDRQPKAINLPHIPHDVRLSFLLRNRATIDEQGRCAIKDEQEQPLDITRAIYFWRLDEVHQFQRYRDSSRYNIAIFVALLTASDDRLERSSFEFPDSTACQFVIAYLAAVLEHHTDAAKFEKREAFVKLWKECKYDFFTFAPAPKKTAKNLMKGLSKEWESELDRTRKHLMRAKYNAMVAKFVGVLVPGRENQRGPDYRAPHKAIEDLKAQSGIKKEDLAKYELYEALEARKSDYLNWDPSSEYEQPQENVPQVPEEVNVFGVPMPNIEHLNAGANQGVPPAKWRAMGWSTKSPSDVNQDAVPIADMSTALHFLRTVKPRNMLKKLMELFPRTAPVFELSAIAGLSLNPSADEREEPVGLQLPMTYEEMMGTAISTVNTKKRAHDGSGDAEEPSPKRCRAEAVPSQEQTTVTPRDAVATQQDVGATQQDAGATQQDTGSTQQDAHVMQLPVSTTQPSSSQPAPTLPVDDSLLIPHTTWQFTPDTPATTSGPSIFGDGSIF